MAKGGSFEREIAKALSLWWTENTRDDVFYRSHASGGRFTSRRKIGKDTALQGGDITASDPIGEPLISEWSIEIKTGYSGKKKLKDASGEVIKVPVYSSKKNEKDKIIKWKNKVMFVHWDVLDFIDSKQKEPILEKMWNQCNRDAKLTHRTPVLIFRRNGKTPCIMFETSYILKTLDPHFNTYKGNLIRLYINNSSCSILSLQNFFEWIPDIRSALNKK